MHFCLKSAHPFHQLERTHSGNHRYISHHTWSGCDLTFQNHPQYIQLKYNYHQLMSCGDKKAPEGWYLITVGRTVTPNVISSSLCPSVIHKVVILMKFPLAWWDLIPGSHTLQSCILPLDHCDQQVSTINMHQHRLLCFLQAAGTHTNIRLMTKWLECVRFNVLFDT